jgi:hypothetical protein
MECVKMNTHLGVIISFDGSYTENISKRVSKGNGESILLNEILYNSETWYGPKTAENKELEHLDKDFLRSLFEVPYTAPASSLFLERVCQYQHHLSS